MMMVILLGHYLVDFSIDPGPEPEPEPELEIDSNDMID